MDGLFSAWKAIHGGIGPRRGWLLMIGSFSVVPDAAAVPVGNRCHVGRAVHCSSCLDDMLMSQRNDDESG